MSIHTNHPVIAIHQPNYLPWAGYFYKMALSDIFVFHDHVEMTKAGPTRRTKIPNPMVDNGWQYITVPLQKHSDFAYIDDLLIAEAVEWRSKHLQKLKTIYSASSHYKSVINDWSEWYDESRTITQLGELNAFFIRKIATWLGIETSYNYSSKIPVLGKGDERNLKIVKHLQGLTYISGVGSQNYQNNDLFANEGIELTLIDSLHAVQTTWQSYAIDARLSIVELMMKIPKELLQSWILSVKKNG